VADLARRTPPPLEEDVPLFLLFLGLLLLRLNAEEVGEAEGESAGEVTTTPLRVSSYFLRITFGSFSTNTLIAASKPSLHLGSVSFILCSTGVEEEGGAAFTIPFESSSFAMCPPSSSFSLYFIFNCGFLVLFFF